MKYLSEQLWELSNRPAREEAIATVETIETISIRQAAERVGVTTRTIRKWFAAGKLTRYTICGRPRVALSELAPRKVEPMTQETRA